jgi:hypothetical protein
MGLLPEHERVLRPYIDALARHDVDGLAAAWAPDYEETYPQSGERIVGRENARAVFTGLPVVPTVVGPVRLTSCGRVLAMAEVLLDYDGSPSWLVAAYEIHDGRMHRETAYFASQFDVPAWRAELVERFDPLDPVAWQGEGDDVPVDREFVAAYVRGQIGRDTPALAAMRHPDLVSFYPQSGERIQLAAELKAAAIYPGGLPRQEPVGFIGGSEEWVITPTNLPIRVEGGGDSWFCQAIFEYASGERWHVALVLLTRGGLIWRQWMYFAELFEAPAWRAHLVERFDGSQSLG